MLEINLLNKKEFVSVYNKYMLVDFPSEELKTKELILSFIDSGIYFPYGLFENGELRAYAMMFGLKEHKYMLLDYYAVCSNLRSKGYGSKFLKLLKENLMFLNGIIFEVESGKTAIGDEIDVCKKRIRFYLKNGLVEKNLTCILNGVDLRIFLLPVLENGDEQLLFDELDSIYKIMYGEEIYGKSVFLKNI